MAGQWVAPGPSWLLRMVVHLYDGFYIYGDPLFPTRQDQQCEAIKAALQLLETVDPRRYRRSQQHAFTIMAKEAGSSCYVKDIPMIKIRTRGRARWVIAETIVHETTHALLESKGFRYRRRLRARIERICEVEAARFATSYFSLAWGANDAARYLNGLRHGRWRRWSSNGKLLGEVHLSHGTGRWIGWYDNGKKAYEGHLVADERDGVWTTWNEEGRVERTTRYQRGRMTGVSPDDIDAMIVHGADE